MSPFSLWYLRLQIGLFKMLWNFPNIPQKISCSIPLKSKSEKKIDSFNPDLSSWNVGNVKDMIWMFEGCRAFNSDLSSWNVSSVTNMRTMFMGCRSFNGDLSSWNVSSVTKMAGIFVKCPALRLTFH